MARWQAVRLMPEGVEKWVWVMDFHGFGFADCNPKIGKIFLDLTATHYPERLGNIIVAGAPTLFNGLWSMLKPLVDDVTKEKIRFVPYDLDSKTKGQHLRDGMMDIFGEELTEWMVAEMADNRRISGSMKKVGALPGRKGWVGGLTALTLACSCALLWCGAGLLLHRPGQPGAARAARPPRHAHPAQADVQQHPLADRPPGADR